MSGCWIKSSVERPECLDARAGCAQNRFAQPSGFSRRPLAAPEQEIFS